MRNFFFKNWKTFIIYLFYPFINLFAISSFNPSRHPRTPPASMGATTPPCIFPSYSSLNILDPRSAKLWMFPLLLLIHTSPANCPRNPILFVPCSQLWVLLHILVSALCLPLKLPKLPWFQCSGPSLWEQFQRDPCDYSSTFSWRTQ